LSPALGLFGALRDGDYFMLWLYLNSGSLKNLKWESKSSSFKQLANTEAAFLAMITGSD